MIVKFKKNINIKTVPILADKNLPDRTGGQKKLLLAQVRN
jgi:hypothetical protein